MPESVDVTIEPNDKYTTVIAGEWPDDSPPDTEDDYRDEHPAPEAADAYVETIEKAPTAEEMGEDPEELPELTWDDISPSSDPDILSKIATYFDGMYPSESTDVLRSKCRLLPVDVYANAQIAAQAELREE